MQSLSDIAIRDLTYMEASAAAGNFTRAAKYLGINTSTISRRVGRFEDVPQDSGSRSPPLAS